MKMNKKKLIIIGASVFSLTGVSLLFLNFTNSSDRYYGKNLSEQLYNVMVGQYSYWDRSELDIRVLNPGEVVDHAANRFGYGIAPIPGSPGTHTKTDQAIKEMAKYLAEQIEKPAMYNRLGHTAASNVGTANRLKNSYNIIVEVPVLPAGSKRTCDTTPYKPGQSYKYDPISATNLVRTQLFSTVTCVRSAYTEALKVEGADTAYLNSMYNAASKTLNTMRSLTTKTVVGLPLLQKTFGSQIRLSNGKIYDAQVNFPSIIQEFWFNHFNVNYTDTDLNGTRDGYEALINSKMHGTFYSMLNGVIHSNTMSLFLNNNVNVFDTKTMAASNQNLGRELLELHTFGMGPGAYDAKGACKGSIYCQGDVENSALILTGLRSDGIKHLLHAPDYTCVKEKVVSKPQEFKYKSKSAIGRWIEKYLFDLNKEKIVSKEVDRIPKVLGKKFPTGVASNSCSAMPSKASPAMIQNQINNYLKFLSSHAQTKKNVCGKLVSRFVASVGVGMRGHTQDKLNLKTPVIRACIDAWGDYGNLQNMYKAILLSAETWSTHNYQRFEKNPVDLAVSAARSTGITHLQLANLQTDKFNATDKFFTQMHAEITKMGLPYKNWGTPDGYKENSGWVNQAYFIRWLYSSVTFGFTAESLLKQNDFILKNSSSKRTQFNANVSQTINSVEDLLQIGARKESGRIRSVMATNLRKAPLQLRDPATKKWYDDTAKGVLISKLASYKFTRK